MATATVEEVVGVIQGLAAVVKEQQATNRDLSAQTQQQIVDLASSVKELSLAVNKKNSGQLTPLRLPQLTLPEYTGNENLDRFTEQLVNVLTASGVDPSHWITYLKQQCHRDSRAFDIVCLFESENITAFSSRASSAEHVELFERCVNNLLQLRGVPRDQQIRNLLATYYAMAQQPKECISDFSHRFLETQNSLEKLLPGIHRSSSGDMEIIHAFTMKLKPCIAKHLLSRDADFPDLAHTIEAAKRFEAIENSIDVVPSSEFAPVQSAALITDRHDVRARKSDLSSSHSGTAKPCWYYKSFIRLIVNELIINVLKAFVMFVPNVLSLTASFVFITLQ